MSLLNLYAQKIQYLENALPLKVDDAGKFALYHQLITSLSEAIKTVDGEVSQIEKKSAKISRARIIETDPSTIFKFDEQLKAAAQEIQEINETLETWQKKLQGYQSLLSGKK